MQTELVQEGGGLPWILLPIGIFVDGSSAPSGDSPQSDPESPFVEHRLLYMNRGIIQEILFILESLSSESFN